MSEAAILRGEVKRLARERNKYFRMAHCQCRGMGNRFVGVKCEKCGKPVAAGDVKTLAALDRISMVWAKAKEAKR